MPEKNFSTDGQYAKRVVIVADDGFKEFVDQSTIVLTKGVIIEAGKVAKDYYSYGRLSFADVNMATYQELQSRLKQLEVTGIELLDEVTRLSALVDTSEAMVMEKWRIIEGLEADRADIAEYAEIIRGHRESIKGKDKNITRLQCDVQSQKKENREQAETLVAQEQILARKRASFSDLFDELLGYRDRNWWQRLFKVGK